MACAHPLHISPSYYVSGHYYSPPEPYSVPCGKCVNCIRDRQNFYIDRAEYEFSHRLTASFLTLTYDDPHAYRRCGVLDPVTGFATDVVNGKTVVRTSLRFKDVQNFLCSLRHYVKAHPEMHGVLCQPNFSYAYCGEYGDQFGRCHFHVLIFGLDFAFMRKVYEKLWRYGFVDTLPLLDGGIRYLVKYMDKFERGETAFLKYDCRGVARPRLRLSIGFGEGLLWDNTQDIIDNFYTYPCGKGKRRPISTYWKLLLTGHVVSRDVTRKTWAVKDPYYVAFTRQKIIDKMRSYHLKDFSPRAVDDFRLKLARIREENLIAQLRAHHVPVDDYHSLFKSRFGWKTVDSKVVHRLPTYAQRVFAEEYYHYVSSKWLGEKFANPYYIGGA